MICSIPFCQCTSRGNLESSSFFPRSYPMRFLWYAEKDMEFVFHQCETIADAKEHSYVFADLITFKNGENFSSSVIWECIIHKRICRTRVDRYLPSKFPELCRTLMLIPHSIFEKKNYFDYMLMVLINYH